MFDRARTKLLSCGFLLRTVGVRLLTSQDAKKRIRTSPRPRCADEVVKTANQVKEGCADIAAEAKAINECRSQQEREREIEDAIAIPAEAN